MSTRSATPAPPPPIREGDCLALADHRGPVHGCAPPAFARRGIALLRSGSVGVASLGEPTGTGHPGAVGGFLVRMHRQPDEGSHTADERPGGRGRCALQPPRSERDAETISDLCFPYRR